MNILVTGGSGYIGSHTTLLLLKEGHDVTVLDHFQKDKTEQLDAIKDEVGEFEIISAELKNLKDIKSKLKRKKFDAVIHFAAYIEVGISTKEPVKFIQNNVVGSQNLFSVLLENGTKNIVFSSSAAVYGTPDSVPIKEDAPIKTENPYAYTKYIIEEILRCYSEFYGVNALALRYFNPSGSYNGVLGERHQPETHLIPRLLHSLIAGDFEMQIFGTDYDTPDGTTVRDYIHVLDLAEAHVKSIEYLEQNNGFDVFNVGTGKGASIREVIDTIEKVTGKKLKYSESGRREGDSARLVADTAKINKLMGWKSKYLLEDILESAWKWEQKRPISDYN
ncbi:MAG: UDP-glucose 4-epimerase GalE [Candidatus Dojkabacteria bacterium]